MATLLSANLDSASLVGSALPSWLWTIYKWIIGGAIWTSVRCCGLSFSSVRYLLYTVACVLQGSFLDDSRPHRKYACRIEKKKHSVWSPPKNNDQQPQQRRKGAKHQDPVSRFFACDASTSREPSRGGKSGGRRLAAPRHAVDLIYIQFEKWRRGKRIARLLLIDRTVSRVSDKPKKQRKQPINSRGKYASCGEEKWKAREGSRGSTRTCAG